jgi:putative ABC transport system permease protein
VELDTGHKIEFSCVMWATPEYFSAMRTAIVAGRDFSSRDQQGAERVAVVTEEFARAAGGTRAVLGHKVKSVFGAVGTALTIVGIAHTLHYDAGTGDNPMPILFLPFGQNPYPFMTLVARVRGRTEAYLPIARDAVQSVDRQVPVFDVKTLDQRLAESLARPRFYTTAVVFFGAFGLLLAVIGVYGVASYSIIQRTHELGVRIAIGASAQRMRWMLLGQSLLPVAIGMAVGVAGAIGLGQFLQHLLDTAQRVDGLTVAIAAAILAAIAAVAVWSASERILRLDPMQVLRAE